MVEHGVQEIEQLSGLIRACIVDAAAIGEIEHQLGCESGRVLVESDVDGLEDAIEGHLDQRADAPNHCVTRSTQEEKRHPVGRHQDAAEGPDGPSRRRTST
jgi:hypothetical protein